MREIHSLAELKFLLGRQVALSEWMLIDQERVNLFADATGDRQWIHLDAERSGNETSFGGTIAHGFLTLSLIPMMMESVIHMSDVKMALNYGMNKLRFPAPLPVGSRVRARISLLDVEDLDDNGAQLIWQVAVEREGGEKPVCVAELITRRYS